MKNIKKLGNYRMLRNKHHCETFIQLTGVNNDTLLRIFVKVRLVAVIIDVRTARRVDVLRQFHKVYIASDTQVIFSV